MSKFSISPDIFALFPDTMIGLVVARNIKNDEASDKIASVLRQAESEVQKRYQDKLLTDEPTIQVWRKAYKLFKAGDYRCSAENLARRVIKGNHIPTINPLVDLYNAISLRYTLPVGGEDLDSINGAIRLDLADGTELFVPLGSSENDPPELGEIVYKDDQTVLCRKWNWRESDMTKLTPQTQKAIFFIEGLLESENQKIRQATHDYAELIQTFCNASTTIYFLDRSHTSIELC